jgi:hypothetical protein
MQDNIPEEATGESNEALISQWKKLEKQRECVISLLNSCLACDGGWPTEVEGVRHRPDLSNEWDAMAARDAEYRARELQNELAELDKEVEIHDAKIRRNWEQHQDLLERAARAALPREWSPPFPVPATKPKPRAAEASLPEKLPPPHKTAQNPS